MAYLDEVGMGVRLEDHQGQSIWLQGEDEIGAVRRSLSWDHIEAFSNGWGVTFPDPGYSFPERPAPDPYPHSQIDPAILPLGTKIEIEDGHQFLRVEGGWHDGTEAFPAGFDGRYKILVPAEFTYDMEQAARDAAFAAAKDPITSPRELAGLATSRIAGLRLLVAQNTLATQEVLAKPAKDSFAHIRAAVAVNPATGQGLLHELAQDEDATVRWLVAKHPNTGPEVLQRLTADKAYTVRLTAQAHPSMPEPKRVLHDHAQLDQFASELKASHAGLDISYGYIGNVGRDHDDRSWSIGIRPKGATTPWTHQQLFHMGDGPRVALDLDAFEPWLEKRIQAGGQIPEQKRAI